MADKDYVAIVPIPQDAGVPQYRCAEWGEPEEVFDYEVTDGMAMHMALYRKSELKKFSPFSYGSVNGERAPWVKKSIPTARPLFRLKDLLLNKYKDVLIVEGEKTAIAAQRIFSNLVVVTSSGGAKASRKTDWSPLHSRHILIWPDNDEAGFAYAKDVASILAKQVKAKSIRVVTKLTDVPQSWDLADDISDQFDIHDALRNAEHVETAFPGIFFGASFHVQNDEIIATRTCSNTGTVESITLCNVHCTYLSATEYGNAMFNFLHGDMAYETPISLNDDPS